MNWLEKLERRYGRYALSNLTSLLVAGQIVVYAVELFVNQYIGWSLNLNLQAILHGEVWRLLTFVFVPFSGGSILNMVIGTYFTWFVGSALEREWGDFRYNLYILAGMVGAVLACLVTGSATTYCLSLSLFLAFAMLYPNLQVYLFFVLPVRVKYLGVVAGGIWLLSFLSGGTMLKLNYLLCMLGFVLFFGPALYRNLRAWVRREQWKRRNRR